MLPSPPTLGPSLSPLAVPTNHQATSSCEPLPQALKGPYAQRALRQGAPVARTNPPLHVPLSGQPGSGCWPKKTETTERPHPYLPPPVLTANLHHLFLSVL